MQNKATNHFGERTTPLSARARAAKQSTPTTLPESDPLSVGSSIYIEVAGFRIQPYAVIRGTTWLAPCIALDEGLDVDEFAMSGLYWTIYLHYPKTDEDLEELCDGLNTIAEIARATIEKLGVPREDQDCFIYSSHYWIDINLSLPLTKVSLDRLEPDMKAVAEIVRAGVRGKSEVIA